MTTISKHFWLRSAALAALTAIAFTAPASAQQAPTLDDLEVVGEGQPQADQQADQGAPVDGSQDLAAEAQAQDPALAPTYQAASPDLRYADPAATNRIEDQAQGNYGTMDRSLSVPMGTTQDAWNSPYKNMAQGQSAPGVVRFRWSQELQMPIRMREFMVTMIVLPDFEDVKDIYLGESMYFEAMKVRGNTVALRVAQAGIDTNLNILGSSGNLYSFYLRAEGYNTKSITDMTVFVDAAPVNPGVWFKGSQTDQSSQLKSNTVQPVQQMAATQQGSGQAEPGAVQGSNLYIPSLDLKFVHKMYEVHPGDRAIAPEYVATDGRWTYFWYGDKAGMVDRPVVYRLVDGVEERVATRVIGAKGETLVAEAVGEFVLRNGQKTVCIKVGTDGSVSVQ